MMTRVIVVAVLSMAAGAAASYWYTRSFASTYVVLAPDADARQAGGPAETRPESVRTLLERESGIAERAAIYQVAAHADAATLRAMLVEASQMPRSASRDLLLSALLERVVADDVGAGLELAAGLDLNARQATALGLTLFEALGPSTDSMAQVLAALPQIPARRFRLEALERWATEAPERAYQEALAIDDRALRAGAVQRVASVWAERDLAGALAEAQLLEDDNVGRAFRSAVVRHMAEIDPAQMVAYVNAWPEHENRLTRVVTEQLQLMEPLEALGWAEQLVGRIGEFARRTALQSWGREDPLAAFAYAESMPIGDERTQLLHSVAMGYGRQDPDAALAWVGTLIQAPTDLQASVIAGIAQVDPVRALDLAFAEEPQPTNGFRFARGRFSMLNAVVNSALTSPDIAVTDVLERVAALSSDNERRNALQRLTQVWLRNDPRSVFDWVTTEGNVSDPSVFSQLAQNLARSDPAMAASYTDRVPAGLRNAWIANVAQNYARLSPQKAVDWLSQFRDEPAYAAGVAAIVHRAVDFDPPAAANLLATLNDTGRNTQQAAASVASGWARRDEPAARLWVSSLTEGEVRDSALSAFIGQAYQDTLPEASLLAMFSSEEQRQESLTRSIYSIARENPDEARRLLDEHISIPRLHAQVQHWLDQRQDEDLVIYPGGVIIRN